MASSESGDGSEHMGSPGGLLPAAACLLYDPYPHVAIEPQMHKDGCRVTPKSLETAVLRLTRGVFPAELL